MFCVYFSSRLFFRIHVLWSLTIKKYTDNLMTFNSKMENEK